jgi:hypothetical protein
MSMNPDEVTINAETYLLLTRAKEQSERIIAEREQECREADEARRLGYGSVIFITIDGLKSLERYEFNHVMPEIRRPCRSDWNLRFDSPDDESSRSQIFRRYKFTSRRITGIMVYEEVP